MENKATFPCAQGALYITNDLIIDRLTEHLPDFVDFRGVYTDDFCDVLRKKNAAARALPNDQMRSLDHETYRDELITLGKTCRSNFQRLKRYISHSVPVSQQIMNWDAAGWAHYEAASNENWVALMEMMDMGSLYIADKSAQLEANGNKPAGFVASFSASATAFNAKYMLFDLAQQDARVGTAAKIDMSNEIYALIIDVCKDAAIIYEDNAVVREQFTFSTVCSLVAPAGASGAVVTVINADTNKPMIAMVSVQGTNKHATTDGTTGRCDIAQLASGQTVFVVDADGFVSQSVTQELTTGTTSRITVELMPMFNSQPTVGSPPSSVGSSPSSVVGSQPSVAGSPSSVVGSPSSVVGSQPSVAGG